MECSEALDLFYESFDGQITPAEAALLNGHRRTCFACAGTLAKAQRFQELISHVPQLMTPKGLETRVIERVLHSNAHTGNVLLKVHRPALLWQRFRPAYAFGGAMAAVFAVFFIVHGVLTHNATIRPDDQTITASVQGSLHAIAPDNKGREVAEADTPLSTGEMLSPVGAASAIVAITPHLALTLQSGAQVQVRKLHRDVNTGAADAIYLSLLRGTLKVNEILHRDVSPIHVATDQATFVPTGTAFSVSARNAATDLTVFSGSVQVFMPGRNISVLAGHGVHITKDAIVRNAEGRKATGLPK
ncbi:MAG: hypothetical protein DLM53_08510 [Candidatus Eremiobacter antarcticus]|nr:FecR domain-containing protein [Candidatus Eremiobacteraeota bacterium]MBC5809130.1 FecR domain-containing protein [Candidatus Eremiobacteraeota bacterium]PZR61616.1 MAG: hypothetical protein DLM53_08510 [Candidatus Eremiobacter sp. RRmetagenome_bin22]